MGKLKTGYIKGSWKERRAALNRMTLLDTATMALCLNNLISKAQATAIHKEIETRTQAKLKTFMVRPAPLCDS